MKTDIVTTEQVLAVQDKVAEIMDILGIAPSQNNIETPYRIAKMYCLEVFRNINSSTLELDNMMTTFPNPNRGNTPVVVNGIKFVSFCEHHWLPFMGYVDISYVPDDSILGLSKFPRAVEWFAKKPQVQERLTKEIGEYLVGVLRPKELTVVIRDVRHTCVEARGAKAECTTNTYYEYRKEI